VTILGTRTDASTIAVLNAQPEELVLYATKKIPQIELLRALATRTRLKVQEAERPPDEIQETGMLFVDLERDRDTLASVLNRHAPKVHHYLVVPGTSKFGQYGEIPGAAGLWPAVEQFLALGTFCLKQQFTHHDGLTVLERL
jgi:hypothetical protein